MVRNVTADRRRLWMAFLLLGFGCHPQLAARPAQLREGIYQVVAQSCPISRGGRAECSTVQYIELVRGRFYGVPDNGLALVEWQAGAHDADEYTYQARPLRGHARDAREYVIDEVEDDLYRTREWFVVKDDIPTEYYLEKRSANLESQAISSVHLKLAPVTRDARLRQKLPYPEPLP